MKAGERVPLRRARTIKTEQEEDETYLPPRHVIHPSEQGKWTRIFYVTLLWLFIILVVGLTFWGIRYS